MIVDKNNKSKFIAVSRNLLMQNAENKLFKIVI